jgi:hypothetical protein
MLMIEEKCSVAISFQDPQEDTKIAPREGLFNQRPV